MGIYINSPCLGCKEREIQCHDTCTKYLEFKATGEQIKQAKIKFNESISAVARHQRAKFQK